MDCKQAKEYINLYIDGELGGEETRALLLHTETCGSCAKLMLDMSALKEGLLDLPEIEPPAGLARSAIKKARRKRPRVYAYLSACVAAALALIVILTSGILPGPDKNSAAASAVAMEDSSAEKAEVPQLAMCAPAATAAPTSAPDAESMYENNADGRSGFGIQNTQAPILVEVPSDSSDSFRSQLMDYIKNHDISETQDNDGTITFIIPEDGLNDLVVLMDDASITPYDVIEPGDAVKFVFK